MAKLILNPQSDAAQEVSLPRTLLAIGRDPSNDLVLSDRRVSRRHALIEYRDDGYYLRDCQSRNGSYVNHERVSERSLQDGDMVMVGGEYLLFRTAADPDRGV